FQKMQTAWLSGDVAAIAHTFDTELKQAPELRDVLIVKRNAAWAQWIDDRLEQPGTVMVAVGAGHLAGSDSVQAMLKTRGIEARRLQ
ncbi:MAG: TraB/GumN family protein, partial [Pseudomonadota bacterium]|nr:TraB/GumN family protein [Pseudomonadota bacterium]